MTSTAIERGLGAIVAANNRLVHQHASDRDEPNPRRPGHQHWSSRLEAEYPIIRAEWQAFSARGGVLPRIEDLIDEHQGNEGAWRAGLLVSRGRPVPVLADRFPATLRALTMVDGLWSALWSVLEPGTELPSHRGPNAGMLRYHLGVACGPDTGLEVAGTTTAYRDGAGILFDDTVDHAAWNRGPVPRATLFLEVIRPCPFPYGLVNGGVQRLLARDPRYASAPARAAEWDHALNR